MRKYIQSLVLVCLVLMLAAGASAQSEQQRGYRHRALQDPEMLELSKEYSRKVVEQHPEVGKILESLGLKYVHELDPTKTYTFNKATGDVTVASSGIGFFGFGSVVAQISSSGGDILGLGKTVITCPFGAQTANVSGFMASSLSRDPAGAGIKRGTLVLDTFLDSVSEVRFRILKAAGGARNLSNRTTMETSHTGSCGGDVKFTNLVSTWPPLRIQMAIDDTGSMGEELGGVKAALTNFIATQNTSAEQVQRGISYELISFKDSPTLRLANTEDTAAAISAVNTLSASGGDDCPEDSLGALNLALDRVTGDEDSEGQIVLVTDASPGPGSVDGVISRARSLGVRVNVMLSGDCVSSSAASVSALSTAAAVTAVPSARDVFKRIADETGGLYFYKPGGTADDYSEILAKIFARAAGGNGNDTTPPVVTLNATPNVIWPPDHKMVRIGVEVSAVDDTDPSPVISLVGVTVSDPDDGQGDGHTTSDVQITEAGEIYVRAERSGSGHDRFYTITYRATDKSGNVGFGTADVRVPHNK